MSIHAQPGATFEVGASGLASGLVGTIGVRIIDTPTGTTLLARTTSGINEQPPGSGYYTVTLTAPTAQGTYSVVFDTGVISPSTVRVVDLVVVGSLLTLTVPQSVRDRLARMTEAGSEPVLATADLDDLVLLAARRDADGLFPDDDDWTPTFDYNAGAAEGWRWKAARVAAAYDYAVDGQSVWRSQMFEHCMEMARHYARRIKGSLEIGTGALTRNDLIANL